MSNVIDFTAWRQDERLRGSKEITQGPKHPTEIVVFEGVTLHDLWVQWTGHEPQSKGNDDGKPKDPSL